MIQKINNAMPILTKVTKNPKSAIAATVGTLAVLSTHQVWPHPERPGGLPQIEVQPEVPTIDINPDIEPSEITPFGDIVSSDNIVDAFGHIADKAKDTFEHVRDFFESLGH